MPGSILSKHTRGRRTCLDSHCMIWGRRRLSRQLQPGLLIPGRIIFAAQVEIMTHPYFFFSGLQVSLHGSLLYISAVLCPANVTSVCCLAELLHQNAAHTGSQLIGQEHKCLWLSNNNRPLQFQSHACVYIIPYWDTLQIKQTLV